MTPAAKLELETDSPSASHLRLVRDGVDIRIYSELVSAGQRAETHGRSAQARELYETALTRLSGAESGARASDLLRWIARTHLVEANLELALDCANAAVAIAEAHDDEAAVGNAINIQANLHCQQGELDEAEGLYHRAGESAARSGDAKLAAMTAQNLAVIANIRGDLDTARQYYESSLLAYRTLGLAKDVCVALNNLGLLHTQRELWAEAAVAYDEAMCIADALGDQNACVQIDVNRAECLVAQGRHAEAREACDRATLRSSRVQDSGILGELHKAFGIVERETGNFERAELCLLRAKAIATQRQNLLLLADVTKECAELHRRQGRNRDTLQSLNQAHRLFQQLRARRELADLGRRMERLETSFLDVARRWGESIESKDHYTQGHCERVAELACALAARTGMEEQSLFWFRIGALLHDVGKLVIPPEVLNKSGSLTPDEWTLMRNHPVAGVEMLADVEFPWDVRPIVESHHERWDGAGYPHGLRGESIPFVARILCIADVYDALTSQRSYKKAMTHAEAIDAMRLEVGAQFDPQLFALFEELAPAAPNAGVQAAMPRLVPHAASPAASHDELTELPLRRAFSQAATAALAARRPDDTVAMLVIDVDRFKLINDTYGHPRGDDVLRAVAHVLREHKRSGDFLGRYAG
ncbi:MAG TPA: HD domain-containing phosphohydrolase, partial [Gemmatimonadaceae bacterium]